MYLLCFPLISILLGLVFFSSSAHAWKIFDNSPQSESDFQKQFTIDLNARYIDFENGDDRNEGTRQAPWKHHPWDRSASGNASLSRGIQTYIFKKGVTYRGFLDANESGTPDIPIRLTVDPEWGHGKAVLAGSTAFADGWEKCSEKVINKLPGNSKGQVWCRSIQIDHSPQLIWEKRGADITRISIARSPNWEIVERDDPRSQWYELSDVIVELILDVENIQNFSVGDSLSIRPNRPPTAWLITQKKYPLIKVINTKNGKLHVEVQNWHEKLLQSGDFISNGRVERPIKGIGGTHSILRRLVDRTNLGAAETDAYTGGTIWAERRTMPKVDAAIIVSSSWNEHSVSANFHRKASSGPRAYDRYFLEGLPEFLDSPGEYLYQRSGKHTGVLILRLPGDKDPNRSIIEVANSQVILQIKNQSNIEVGGLSFQFSNQLAPGTPESRHAALYASAIQIRGDTNNIKIDNCDFSYLPAGVVAFPEDRASPSILDNIEISDNVFKEIDGSPIALGNGQSYFKLKKNGSRLIHVTILRNKLEKIGYRTLGQFGVGSHGDGIQVMGGEMIEVAGNQIDQVWGSGISVTLGAEHRNGKVERPLLRSMVYHNTIVNSLLGAQDGGGINSWMGGPAYIFNNISGNPVGCMHSRQKTSTRKNWYRRGCYGVGIYLDGQYKGYVFNNIIWGNNNNVNDRIYNSVALNEAMGFMNIVFNNTFYRFGTGLHKGMFQHNRNYYLGNLFLDMGLSFIEQEPRSDTIDYGTLAFTKNQFFGKTSWFGKFGTHPSNIYQNFETWQSALRDYELMGYDTGTKINQQPVRDAQEHDFHPTNNSPTIDNGVKVFVPLALYGVVGEWHFLRRNDHPAIINGENSNMNAEWVKRDMFHQIPRNDLQCISTDQQNFEFGTLENWIPGALRFDGKTRYCHLREPEISLKSFDMGTNNFLIEMVVASDMSAGAAGLVGKRGDKGYALELNRDGHIHVILDYGGLYSARVSSESINDGQWHHILIDVDRTQPYGIMIYIDGNLSNGEWRGAPMQALGLTNNADFLVGRSTQGKFSGRLDFLRISRGTLNQAETNIGELYSWEFDGPFLRDFYGQLPINSRDVGAVEFQTP